MLSLTSLSLTSLLRLHFGLRCTLLLVCAAACACRGAVAFAPLVNAAERSFLDEFYISTNGSFWVSNTGWRGTTAASDPCADFWPGVVCADVGAEVHVTGLLLRWHNLNGEIPYSISAMTWLEALWLDGNRLRGAVPPLAALRRVQGLGLGDNEFNDTLPQLYAPEAPDPPSPLKQLLLDSNAFRGTFPVSYSRLYNLELFDVSNNNIIDELPPWLGTAFPRLSSLRASHNSLHGTLPERFLNNAQLTDIRLNDNSLSGQIPARTITDANTGDIQPMGVLDLSNNNFNCLLPESYKQPLFMRADRFNISGNNFACDEVTATWSNLQCTTLRIVSVTPTQFNLSTHPTAFVTLTLDRVSPLFGCTEPPILCYLNDTRVPSAIATFFDDPPRAECTVYPQGRASRYSLTLRKDEASAAALSVGTAHLSFLHQCPNACSGHGVCDELTGLCACDTLEGGAQWATPENGCRYLECCSNLNTGDVCCNNGFCNAEIGKCACFAQYTDSDAYFDTDGASVNCAGCSCLRCLTDNIASLDDCSGHGKCVYRSITKDAGGNYIHPNPVDFNGNRNGDCVCDAVVMDVSNISVLGQYELPMCRTIKFSCPLGFTGLPCSGPARGVCDNSRGICHCIDNAVARYSGAACDTAECPRSASDCLVVSNNCSSYPESSDIEPFIGSYLTSLHNILLPFDFTFDTTPFGSEEITLTLVNQTTCNQNISQPLTSFVNDLRLLVTVTLCGIRFEILGEDAALASKIGSLLALQQFYFYSYIAFSKFNETGATIPLESQQISFDPHVGIQLSLLPSSSPPASSSHAPAHPSETLWLQLSYFREANFDSTLSLNIYVGRENRPRESKCAKDCNYNMLRNNYCNWACNVESCFFDGGDCLGYCDENCTWLDVGSSHRATYTRCSSTRCLEGGGSAFNFFDALKTCGDRSGGGGGGPECILKDISFEIKQHRLDCSPQCNSSACHFQGFSCGRNGECAPNCHPLYIGDGECDDACNVAACEFDLRDCVANASSISPAREAQLASAECATGCDQRRLNNNVCDDACNNVECAYDGGDCHAHSKEFVCGTDGAQSCTLGMLNNGHCEAACAGAPACAFDGTDSTRQCASNCSLCMLRNGVCDVECQTESCLFDSIDCDVRVDVGDMQVAVTLPSLSTTRSNDLQPICSTQQPLNAALYKQRIANVKQSTLIDSRYAIPIGSAVFKHLAKQLDVAAIAALCNSSPTINQFRCIESEGLLYNCYTKQRKYCVHRYCKDTFCMAPSPRQLFFDKKLGKYATVSLHSEESSLATSAYKSVLPGDSVRLVTAPSRGNLFSFKNGIFKATVEETDVGVQLKSGDIIPTSPYIVIYTPTVDPNEDEDSFEVAIVDAFFNNSESTAYKLILRDRSAASPSAFIDEKQQVTTTSTQMSSTLSSTTTSTTGSADDRRGGTLSSPPSSSAAETAAIAIPIVLVIVLCIAAAIYMLLLRRRKRRRDAEMSVANSIFMEPFAAHSATSTAAAPASRRRPVHLQREGSILESTYDEAPSAASDRTSAHPGDGNGGGGGGGGGFSSGGTDQTFSTTPPTTQGTDSIRDANNPSNLSNDTIDSKTTITTATTATTNMDIDDTFSELKSIVDKRFRIAYNDLEQDKKIGEGAYGSVYKGRWRDTTVALKEVKAVAESAKQQLITEATTMQMLRPHDNIVTLFGVCVERKVIIVTEFCVRGSLDDLLYGTKPYPFTTRHIERIVLGSAKGLHHLHSEGFIHRDVAARNVLLNKKFVAKIADFGMTRAIVHSDTNNNTSNNSDSGASSESGVDEAEFQTMATVGPIRWMAPEQLGKRKYSVKSDVYAFGMLAIECLTRKQPWPHDDSNMVVAQRVLNGERHSVPADLPEWLRRLLKQIISHDTAKRPSMAKIVKTIQRNEWPHDDDRND